MLQDWIHLYQKTDGSILNKLFYDNCRNSRALLGLFLLSISGQTREFIIYAMLQRARADNLTICYHKKKQTNCCLRIHSAIALWIHNFFDNAMTKLMINDRTDARKTDWMSRVSVVRINKSKNNGIMIIKFKIKFGKVTQISPHALIACLLNDSNFAAGCIMKTTNQIMSWNWLDHCASPSNPRTPQTHKQCPVASCPPQNSSPKYDPLAEDWLHLSRAHSRCSKSE